jgi:trk system potassium uptake protein TrkA
MLFRTLLEFDNISKLKLESIVKIVIVGAGEVGYNIASRMALENKEVVVIDNNPEALRRISENLDVQVIEGSGSSPLVLNQAGIANSEILLAVTNSDETNLVACIICNIISPTTKKLARMRNSDFDAYHEHFKENAPYINTVINPEIEAVNTIEKLMNIPGAVDATEFADGKVQLVSIRLNVESKFSGMKLKDIAPIIGDRNLLIAALIREDELIVPGGDDRLLAGDLVYFISETEFLQDNLLLFGKAKAPLKRVLIVGGGRIGWRLSKSLEKKNIKVKIIEKDQRRCKLLSEHMKKAVVLHGDGSDQSLLYEENIRDMDVVVTLTNDEETNILVSLLSKSMGAQNTITKISKLSYFPLMSVIGIEQVVSSRLSAIDSILRHIRKGKIITAFSVYGEQAEVLEAIALKTSAIVGKPLKNVSFPQGSILISIIRDKKIIIPSGESVVNPDDRIIIFATRSSIPKVEKIMTVKLEFF